MSYLDETLGATGWIVAHTLTAYAGIPAILTLLIMINQWRNPVGDDWSMIIVFWLLGSPAALVTLIWGLVVGIVSFSATWGIPQPQRWLPVSLMACVAPLGLYFLL